MAAQPSERAWPKPAHAEGGTPKPPAKESVFTRIKSIMPRLDEQTGPRATGIFIPSWFLAIILVPVCGGILWVATTLTEIRRDQANLQGAVEYRLKNAETQERLNDEHLRMLENEISAMKAGRESQRR
jgi:hypothetical protein